MKLNVVSDLHLSQGGLPPPSVRADLVVLAGDVARPAQAVEWAKSLDGPVLYVPGNHEFYGGTLPGTVRELKRLAEGSQVHVLDNEEFSFGPVRFLGCTLWTDFRLAGDGQGDGGGDAAGGGRPGAGQRRQPRRGRPARVPREAGAV